MSRASKSRLLQLGILTPTLLAEILSCSAPYIRKLCRANLIKAANVSATKGRNEFRIQARDALDFCINTLSLSPDQIPEELLDAAEKQVNIQDSMTERESSGKKQNSENNENNESNKAKQEEFFCTG
jgi:hypothetical protein